MFGVDFSELALVFVVALVVLGPTRLPGLVRKVGHWVGKARSMARQFREQLESEVQLEELNRMTEMRSKPAAPTYPAPPPEFGGEPVAPADAAGTAATPPAPDSTPSAATAAAAASSAAPSPAAPASPVYTPEEAAYAAAEPEYNVPPPGDASHNDLGDTEPPQPQDAAHGRSG